MGMYTTVIAEDGTELQIRSGMLDDMEVYRIGDGVNWYIVPDMPGEGKLLDGTYLAEPVAVDREYSVIIRDHKVFYAGPRLPGPHNIDTPDRSLWTETSWLARDLREARNNLRELLALSVEAEERITFYETLHGRSDAVIAQERADFNLRMLNRHMSNGIKSMLARPSFCRSVLPVAPPEKRE